MASIEKRLAPSHGFTLRARQMSGGTFEKPFRLCFDFAAFRRIKDATGLEIVSDREAWKRLGDADCLPEIFWAAIIRHHPEYDSAEGLDAVRSYIDAENADQVGEAIIEAYLVSLPGELSRELRVAWEKAKRGAAENPPTPPAENGPTSGNPATPSTTSGQ